jgi:tungstate transport system substrate-binding protein
MRFRDFPILSSIALLVVYVFGCSPDEERLLLATTTSVRDSGLLDTLLPVFQERTRIRVQVVAVGSGAALRMGADGNADVLLTHAPEGEQELVGSGAAISREPFMENHFVIAGPSADPAGVRGAASAADAYRRIAESGATYVSRGDDSGTHRREVALLREAGLAADGSDANFVRTGLGMGLTLEVAGERSGYVLSDLGTFLAFERHIGLEILSRPTPELRNVYSVLRISAERFGERINAESAREFLQFLLEPDIQQRIGEYGREKLGRPLFRPLHLDDAT